MTDGEKLNQMMIVYNETLDKVFKKYPADNFRIETQQYNVKISLHKAGPFYPLAYVRKCMRDAGLYARKQMDGDDVHWLISIYVSLTVNLFEHTYNKIVGKGN